ncbi:MAG: hypothetical protein ACRYGA_02130 [Janthinobacterium lividum]
MSTIAFKVNTVERLAATRHSIAVEVDMDEEQMFETVRRIQQRITDTTWADWQRRLDDDAPSAHEAFAGDGSALA